MSKKAKDEFDVRIDAAWASEEDVQYIIELRKRMKQISLLLWVIIGILIYQYWDYINWWITLVAIFSALILGGLVSIVTGKIVESKTGHDLRTQIQIHKNYQQGKYS